MKNEKQIIKKLTHALSAWVPDEAPIYISRERDEKGRFTARQAVNVALFRAFSASAENERDNALADAELVLRCAGIDSRFARIGNGDGFDCFEATF